MLAAALGERGGTAFRIGYVAGLIHYLTSLYWLLLIPVRFAPVVGWLALAAYLALYPATWVWLCWKIYPLKVGQMSPLPVVAGLAGEAPVINRLLEHFLSTRRSQRLLWTLFCAALWVAGEMVLARLFSGFPWNFLGASQYQMLPLIQVSSFTGVYGVSFLVAWLSVSLLCAGVGLIRQPEKRLSWMAELIVPLLTVGGVAAFGVRQIQSASPARAGLKIALIQPSIPQKMIWDQNEARTRFHQLLELSERVLATNQPDLLVWPEAAVPSLFRFDTNINIPASNLARSNRLWLILGADDMVCPPNAQDTSECDFYNSSFLVTPSGEFGESVGIYRKRRLVIFGEYVPFSRWLPFLKDFAQVQGEFTPGKRPVPFVLTDLKVKTSVLICFEDIFPHLTREYAEEDTDFLLNLTNNGWFGESAAQWQHAANAVFRAVENGLPLVRCANNGLTCWVDAQGRLNEVYFPGTKDIYGVGCKIAQVPLLAGQKRLPTFYRRNGDWFGWGCAGFSVLVMATRWLRR